MKKLLCISTLFLMSLCASAQYYVDLGLPSGTLWSNSNEKNWAGDYDYYSYDEAVNTFGGSLPTKEQWEELLTKCTWSWTGNGYRVTGPNYNVIKLPASGCRKSNGSAGSVGSVGCYCSSTRSFSGRPWYIYFDSGNRKLYDQYHSTGYTVRLVQNR